MDTHCTDCWRFIVKFVLMLLLAVQSQMLYAQVYVATKDILIWDTMSPLPEEIDLLAKDGWKSVPAGSADAYPAEGDIVVENEFLSAVFSSGNGNVTVYANYCEALQKLHRGYLRIRETGIKRIELIPAGLKGKDVRMTSIKIISNYFWIYLLFYFYARQFTKE